MDGQAADRIRRARETLEVIRRAASPYATVEDIVDLHELHARHEREAGREDRAIAADERARHARERATH